jgi:CheY-like chemotaxis protein
MRALDTIHRNATAQVQIVNDLLDVSRIVRGSVQLVAKVIPLGPLVTLAVESITPTAEAKGVSLNVSVPSEPLFVLADHDRLQQVFWNLLSNAVKFTSSGGRIDVTLDSEGVDVRVRISDTGTGIAAAFLPHVFERFRQADGSPTRTHGGLGLGLAIVRHLVELHGGRLTAQSEGEGKGATFTVFLPARQAERRAAVPPPAALQRETRIDLEGTHILIVDDEPDARDLLRAMLVGTGARVSEADSAVEALRVFRDDRPQIVLADIAMPGQDGYSLIRAIRGLPDDEGAHVRAVAVSAYARQEDRQRALTAGYDEHLPKPVRPGDLFDALRRVRTDPGPPLLEDSEPGAKIH